MAEQTIRIRGARQHNLKNISLEIPRDALIVFTGVSGSGKSSLAFDTLFAEGQRRYVESLSAYARQFLGQMDKPDVDGIDGLSPAIAIDQKSTNHNPRSTVGTVTEIYDFLRLLYARVGTPHCPQCGLPVERQTIDQMVDQILNGPEGRRLEIRAPLVRGRKGAHVKVLEDLRRRGFVRVRIDGILYELEDVPALAATKKHEIAVVVDRIVTRPTARSRIAESIETALDLAGSLVEVGPPDDSAPPQIFSRELACPHCNISLPELTPRLFSFNAPEGACPACGGLGSRQEPDMALIVPNPDLTLAEGAIAPFAHAHSAFYPELLKAVAKRAEISLQTPWRSLSQ
ncbi:MAG: excinuclease ABC subunit UvrA, partial [Firmicutes bacterium]|nr:excinuclease ABC subunit UvrA [Bacillota bacterium]